jgi:DNA gyrase/topoisomerase IV subunit A
MSSSPPPTWHPKPRWHPSIILGAGRQRRIDDTAQDFIVHLFVASTQLPLVFTNRAKLLKVYEIPDVGTAGRGHQNLVNSADEKIINIIAVKDFVGENIDGTRSRIVKKTA